MLLLLLLLYTFLLPNVNSQSCGCPAIKTITKSQLQALPESKYLANRAITNPTVTVSSTCKITVTCSAMKSSDFNFMIFRKGQPPIFSKRFVKTSSKTAGFSPAGISCVQVNGVYEWQFYGGKVTDMAFAMQPTECGCQSFSWIPPAPKNDKIQQMYGTCDIAKPTCDAKKVPSLMSNTRNMGNTQSTSMVFTDVTCVNKVWYYNNVQQPSLSILCAPEEPINQQVEHKPFKYICGCREIEMLANVSPFQVLLTLYGLYKTEKFRDLTYSNGIISYDENQCLAKISCLGTDTLIMFSGSSAPIQYADGTFPHITCAASPAYPVAESAGNTKKYWFMDGLMLNLPLFSCRPGTGCACKYVPMTPTNLVRIVGTHSFFPIIKSRPLQSPKDNKVGKNCPATVECSANYTLVAFDLTTASVFSSGTMSLSCTTKTKKWSIDKKVDMPEADVLYAICVDFR